MSKHEVFRIAVLSDLHVLQTTEDDTKENGSWLAIDTKLSETVHPFIALEKLIDSLSLEADLVICCGDLADKANSAGLQYAWDYLQKIKEKLKAKYLIGSVGNHDLQSRNNFDPKGELQSLKFPIDDEQLNNQFWAKNFFTKDILEDKVRVLNINSSAFHGYGDCKEPLKEYERGRISDRTLENIQIELSLQGFREMNIAFFHHHPSKWEGRDEKDYSEMINGGKLVELLSNSSYGRWLIIHGHKHWPNIKYEAGGMTSPVIIAAGSFASKRLANSEPNQFYIVELVCDPIEHCNLSIAGKIESWTWYKGSSWRKSKFEDDGLPYNSGFGYMTDISVLSRNIKKYICECLDASDDTYCSWDQIVEHFKELPFLLPNDIKEMKKMLKSIEVEMSNDNDIGWPRHLWIITNGE